MVQVEPTSVSDTCFRENSDKIHCMGERMLHLVLEIFLFLKYPIEVLFHAHFTSSNILFIAFKKVTNRIIYNYYLSCVTRRY